MSKRCPECGCPITNETLCPECGYSFANNKKASSQVYEKGIKGVYHKYFYTEDADPYVDFAAKLCSIPKVATVILFAIVLLYDLLVFLLYFLGTSSLSVLGGLFPLFYSVLMGGGIVAFLLQIIWFGAFYLFWWWVGNIIVDGVRKIRQSKNR